MLSDWIALSGALLTAAVNVAGYLVAWGAMKGTVGALAGRIVRLESEMSALEDLKVDVARVETRLDVLIEQVRELNAAIRWLREPPAPPWPGPAAALRTRG